MDGSFFQDICNALHDKIIGLWKLGTRIVLESVQVKDDAVVVRINLGVLVYRKEFGSEILRD